MENRPSPIQHPEMQELLRDSRRLESLMASPEVRRMIQLLDSRHGAALKAAALRAKQGDPTELKEMVAGLTRSEEGAALADRLNRDISGGEK